MKIFCLGMHKTGTLSLAQALGDLGYRIRHGYKPQSDRIQDALYEGKKPLQYLDEEFGKFDAYADLYAVRWFYPVLDEAYPHSKFILTTREIDDWLESVHSQIEKRPDSPYFHYWYHQTDEQRAIDKCGSEFGIRQYFADRSGDLLEIDITKNTDEQNWEQLCEFLNKPVPDKPFPHKNKSPKGV